MLNESRSFIDELNDLYREKKYHDIINKVSILLQDNYELSVDVLQKLALSYYYIKDYNNSLKYFQQISSIKNNIESWFNVLMSALALKY